MCVSETLVRPKILNPGLKRYLRKIFSEDIEGATRGGDRGDEHAGGPYPWNYDHSTKKLSQ
jgi:hypothetical protein